MNDEETLRLSSASGSSVVPGPLGRRFAAGFIDGMILGVICSLPLIIFLFWGALLDSNSSLLTVADVFVRWLISFFYTAWFYKNRGATPGKQIMRLRVLDHETGQYLSFGQTFMREYIGKVVSVLALGIGFLIMFFRSDRRGWHDFIGGSEVVLLKK
jgi:uncharacterized RDD family membrane protein YckC